MGEPDTQIIQGHGNDYMINIFADEKIYGSAYQEVEAPRPLNPLELSRLNVSIPATVFQGQYGLSCRLYANGSTTSFYCKSLDTRSVIGEGEAFDVTKCFVTKWQKPDSSIVKIKILVPQEAIV